MKRSIWAMPVGVGSTLGLSALLIWLAAAPQDMSDDLDGETSVTSTVQGQPGGKTAPGPSPGRPGEVRLARMADLLGQADYSGPNPKKAYFAAHSHWLKMVDPYGDLSGDRAFLRLKVAFLVPDVPHYLDPGFPKARSFLGGGERIWSYGRGVYESRLALFSPVERSRATTLNFPVRLRAGSILWFGVGGIPKARRSGRLEFWIDLHANGTTTRLWHKTLGPSEMLVWHEDRVDLGFVTDKNASLVFGCRGQGAQGLWLDPVIWAAGRRLRDNVVFVVVDTMRPDAIHALGGKYARTPNMDRLVHEGTAFTNFFTNGAWTRASLVSFFSANYASSVGLTPDKFLFPSRVREVFYRRRLPQFPAHMEKLGYAVAAVVNNFFGLPYTAVGVDHGFSRFTDVRHPRLDSRAITRAALQFLQKNRERPFFLYVHYEALHDYDHRPDYWASKFPLGGPLRMDKYWRAYLSLGALVDAEVGKLVTALDRLGLRRHTLVILTADHGEVFDERHDFFIPFFHTKTLHQHARSVWDEVLHIPMIWSMPGRIREGTKVPVQLRAIDLFPSVLDFLGLSSMGSVAGRSFASLLKPRALHGKVMADRPVYSEGFHIRALRKDGFKYVFRDPAADRFQVRRKMVTRPEELFDLAKDPHEVRDIAPLEPKRTERMRAAMGRIRRESLPERLMSGVSQTEGIVYFQYCSRGKETQKLHLLIWSSGERRLTLAGARGSVVARPQAVREVCHATGLVSGDRRTGIRCNGKAASVSGLAIDLTSGPTCSAVALALAGPVSFQAKEGRKTVAPSQVHVGPFGLPFLSSNRIDPSDPALVSPDKPAVLDQRASGLFVWTNHQTTMYEDPLSSQRTRRSDSLVRMNLLRGGYVKSRSKSR